MMSFCRCRKQVSHYPTSMCRIHQANSSSMQPEFRFLHKIYQYLHIQLIRVTSIHQLIFFQYFSTYTVCFRYNLMLFFTVKDRKKAADVPVPQYPSIPHPFMGNFCPLINLSPILFYIRNSLQLQSLVVFYY